LWWVLIEVRSESDWRGSELVEWPYGLA